MVDEEATTPRSATSTDVLNSNLSPDYPDWSAEDKLASNMLIQDMMEYYPDYNLPAGIDIRENNKGAFFHDRNNDETPPGQPLIEVNPERKISSMAHELGHDALLQSVSGVEGPRVVYSAFKELFADLNSLYFSDIEPEDRELNRDPDKDLSVYEGVSDLLNPKHWEKGIMRIDNIVDDLERENWDSLQTDARVLAGSEPKAAPVLDVRDISYERARAENYIEKLADSPEVSHMFYDNFFGTRDYSPVSDVAETTHDIWSMAQVAGNTEIRDAEQPVRAAYDDNSRIWGKLAGAATVIEDFSLDEIEDRPEEVLVQSIETDLWDAREDMEDVKNNLETIGSPEYFVMNSISDQKYGKKYDVSIDYPHNVGGQLAEQLYLRGIEPMDVVEEPEKYVQLVTQEINRHIENNI